MPKVHLFRNIEEVEGVGPARARAFGTLGYPTLEHLLTIPDNDGVLARIASGVPGIDQWVLRNSILPQARFRQLKDVDVQLAEGLAASGYRTYEALVRIQAETIRAHLADQEAVGTIRSTPELDAIRSIQLEAASMMGFGWLLVELSDSETPQTVIEGALLRIPGTADLRRSEKSERASDAAGRVWFERVTPGFHHCLCSHPNRKRHRFGPRVRPGVASRYMLQLKPGNDAPLSTWDEFSGEVAPSWSPRECHLVETRAATLADLPGPSPMVVRSIENGTAHLACLWRRRVDDTVQVFTVDLPQQEIPPDAERGTVLRRTDGRFAKLDLTATQYRQLRLRTYLTQD